MQYAELELLTTRQEHIKSDIRKICGIADCNDYAPAGLVVASMGISICMHLHPSQGETQADREV